MHTIIFLYEIFTTWINNMRKRFPEPITLVLHVDVKLMAHIAVIVNPFFWEISFSTKEAVEQDAQFVLRFICFEFAINWEKFYWGEVVVQQPLTNEQIKSVESGFIKAISPCIPVLGIPVLNRGDLLERLVKSIDFPVQRLYIINNGNDEEVQSAINRICYGSNPFVHEVHVFYPVKNLGCAASWNAIMRNNQAPWWLISANDMLFGKGDLQKIYDAMKNNPQADIAYIDGYAQFAIRHGALMKAGWFDENFYPAYFEDGDHHRRVNLSGAVKHAIKTNVVHGEAPNWGSHTIASNKKFAEANVITFERNKQYYIEKWGGIDGTEKFDKPFNQYPLTYWHVDQERLRAQEEAWK